MTPEDSAQVLTIQQRLRSWMTCGNDALAADLEEAAAIIDRLRQQQEALTQDAGHLALMVSRERTAKEAAERRVTQLVEQQEAQAREKEMALAQLKGWQDFFSGQPRELPFKGSTGQAKESQLNFAWAMGYDVASDSEVFKLMVGRADRSANRAEAAEARIAVLEAALSARDSAAPDSAGRGNA